MRTELRLLACGSKVVSRRRGFGFLSIVILTAVVLSGCERTSSHARGPVVIFLVDTLRYDRMSAYGNRRPTTPAADRLAREGVRYDSAYSVASWTRPSVAALFTSRYPAEVGASDFAGSLDPRIPVMAEMFRGAGWRTAGFCANRSIGLPALGFRRGFNQFIPVVSVKDPLNRIATADRVVEPAISWIESQADSRFFLYVHVMDPHTAEPQPGKSDYRDWLSGYENMFSAGIPTDFQSREWRLSKYDALIRQADDQFALLRKELEHKGFWKSALVVWVADHGEEFLEHGSLYHGQSLFEELVHIPLIVKAPGWGKPGRIVGSPVSLLDLLPSIATFARLPRNNQWRGVPVNERDPAPSRALYLSENFLDWRLYGLIRGPKRLLVSLTPPSKNEFDVSLDPGEQRPVRIEPELDALLLRYREREMSWLGGLTIEKAESVPVLIEGEIDLPNDVTPFLTLEDSSGFPIDAGNRSRLPLRVERGAHEGFRLHLLSLRELARLDPHLRVTAGGITYRVEPGNSGRIGPLDVRQASMTRLAPEVLSFEIRDFLALGYLHSGDNPR